MNDDLTLGRKLTDEEGKEVRLRLFPFLVKANEEAVAKAQNDADGDEEFVEETSSEDDLNDFIDFIVAMMNNSKTPKQCVEELTEMDMPFCPPPVAQRIQEELTSFMQQITAAATAAPDGGGGDDDDAGGVPRAEDSTGQAEENEAGETDGSEPRKKVSFFRHGGL